METVIVQINNNRAFNFLENLEALNVIKVLKRTSYPQVRKRGRKISDSSSRLSEIQAVTKNINLDLTNFHFNREEANAYD